MTAVNQFRRFSPLLALAFLSACAMPAGKDTSFQALPGGTFDNPGAVIEEPNVFRITGGGASFTTPFSIDCTKLSAATNGWKDALAAGAHKVSISLPGSGRSFGGVLAFCNIHKSATGPSSRSYELVIPPEKIPQAEDGLIASVAEQVTVSRTEAMDFATMMAQPPGAPIANTVTEDYAWMIWFTDRPETMGITFVAPAPVYNPAITHSAASQGPAFTAGASYTVARSATLRSGPIKTASVVSQLSVGDSVVTSGDRKHGFWAVTTVGGQAGWVYAGSLKAN